MRVIYIYCGFGTWHTDQAAAREFVGCYDGKPLDIPYMAHEKLSVLMGEIMGVLQRENITDFRIVIDRES